MNIKRVFALLLTLCMIFSVVSPAAASAHTVVGGADSVGGSNSALGQIGSIAGNGPVTLRDKLLEAQKNQGKGSLTAEAIGRLKNETMEELAKAAEVFGPGEMVSAFVVLEGNPTSEMYADINSVPEKETRALLQTQNLVMQRIRERITNEATLQVRYQFTYLLNAFSVTTEFKNLSEIMEIPGVKTVFIMPEYRPMSAQQSLVPYIESSAQMTDVPSVWQDCGYTGTGMRIAILDTGLYLDHPAFQETPVGASLTVEEIESVLTKLNAYAMMAYQGVEITAEDLYIRGKVPFGFNYADWNLTVDHSADQQGDHGTHVSGIAAANRIEGNEYVGMAPDAQILVMKVFGNGGAMMDGVMAALEDAMVLKCDVANLSLGADAGFSSNNSVIDEVFARIRDHGIMVEVAAGNAYTSGLMNTWGEFANTTDHPDNATVGSPATYINSTVIGSVNNAMSRAPYFSYGEVKVGYKDTKGLPAFATLAELGELEYVFVPGLGYAEDFEGVDVSGKIAVITRGTISFMEKMQNAANAGAVGVLIANNEPGTVSNFSMDFTGVGEPMIPCIIISMEAAAAMAAAEEYVMTVSATAGMVPDDMGWQMSEFSSWGVSPDLHLLPNVSGVGGNVASTVDPSWTGEGSLYGMMSGTSMATPQVAGITALVLQHLKAEYPELSAAERRVVADALVMSTAIPVISNVSGVEASPRQQGSGLVNALGAINSGAYLTVNYDTFGSVKPQIELGDDPYKNGIYNFRFSVVNISDEDKSYSLDACLLTEDILEAVGKVFMAGTDRALSGTVEFSTDYITVPANSEVEISVKVTLSDEDKAWMDANYANGIYVEGYVHLNAEDENGVDLVLPYMGFYGDWNQAPMFDTGYWYQNAFWGLGEPTYHETQHVMWTALGDQDWLLGINPYAGVYDESFYDPRNNVVSPNGDGFMDGLVDIYLSLMRNAKSVTYTYKDEDGHVLNQVIDPFITKTHYNMSYGQIIPNVYSWSGYPIYNYTDAYGNVLPDGTKVTLTIQALTDYGNGGANVNEFNTITIPITVDLSAPVLDDVKEFTENGRNYVQLEVSDASSLAYVVLTNATGSRYLTSLQDGLNFTRNGDTNTWTIVLDVTGHGSNLGVILCDYGCNEASYPVEFNAADNMPELVEGTLYGYRVYDFYYAYDNNPDYMYGWHSIDKETMELTEVTKDYMEYYSLTAAEYVDGVVFAVDAGKNLVWMEPGLFNRYNIVNLGVSVLDMTFDDTTDTMYVLHKDTGVDRFGDPIDVIKLATMDLLTGELNALAEYTYEQGPWCITDVNGELYVALNHSRNMGKLDKDNGYALVTLLDYKEDTIATSTSAYYNQSMTYDEVTNRIYWAHFNGNYVGTMIVIDMTYGEVNDLMIEEYELYGEAGMVGLFVMNETDYALPESDEVVDIVLNKYEALIQVDEQVKLTASPLPWNAELSELTWTSSDESIATVENGVVTGVADGYADITVSDGNVSATCTVRVVKISGHVNGFNYYSVTSTGLQTMNSWFDLNLENMEINATGVTDVPFLAADYNGHDELVYGYDEEGQFWSYDPATGAAEAIGSPINVGLIPKDMAYDYENGIMYAATMGTADGMTVGTLSTVNLKNGQLTELQVFMDAEYAGEGFFGYYLTDEDGNYVFDDFGMPIYVQLPHAYNAYPAHYENPDAFMTLAWGPDGLYSITAQGRLVHLVPALYIDYMTGSYTEVLAAEVIMTDLGAINFQQSLAYDHANDKLVWAAVDYYSMVWIDPIDPAVISLGLPQELGLFQFIGLYTIPENMPERPVYEVESVEAEDVILVTGGQKVSPVTVYPTNATNVSISYSSDNTNVVTVDELGVLTSVGVGTANITVTVTGDNGSSATTTFQVDVLQGTGKINAYLAGDLMDGTSEFWFTFPDSDPSAIDYRAAVPAPYFFYSAEYCADTGYVYGYGIDMWDWTASWQFIVMDPTQNYLIIEQHPLSQNFPFVYDMTYNYAEGVMYAVADVSEESTDLYKVDLATGALLPCMELVRPETGEEMCVLSLAASPDGKLYGVATSLVTEEIDYTIYDYVTVVHDAVLYTFDPANGTIEAVGPTGFKHNSLGSMAFDMDTGNLYWSALYSGDMGYESFLVMLDETTGAGVSLGVPSKVGIQMTGMFIMAENYPETHAELTITAEEKIFGYVGEKLSPATIVTGTGNDVVWTSANESIVAVQADGSLKAVGTGFTTVTATVTDDNGNSVSATVAVSVIAQDAYFLAYNNQTNTWEKIDRRNPVNATPIEGSTTEETLLVAQNVNGVIYGYDVAGNFFTVDAETFAVNMIGKLDLSTITELCDLAYDSINDRLLALVAEANGKNAIYEVDMTSGLISKLVNVKTPSNVGGYYLTAMTVGMDGTVYVLDESTYPHQDIICTVDMKTGNAPMITSFNRVSIYTDADYSQSMITDPMTGMIYVMVTSNGSYYSLASFNPDSEIVTAHGYVGQTDMIVDEWGWSERAGNTYSEILILDTHEHLFVGEVTVLEDNCEHYEATSQYCIFCGDITTVVSDHEYAFVETFQPDCTKSGYDLYECSCGVAENRNLVAAFGHTSSGEADCLNAETCTVCGTTITKALGHDMVLNEEHACPGTYDATCSRCGEAGTKKVTGYHTVYVCEGSGYAYSGTCDICGVTLSYSAYARKVAAGHKNPAGDAVVDCTAGFDCETCGKHVAGHAQHHYDREIIPAQCESGSRTYDCIRCEAIKVYELIGAGHEAEAEPVIENENKPTCTEEGSYDEVVYCAVCGKELSRETITVPATGHIEGETLIEIESAAAQAGETVTMEVVLKNNPGIMGLQLLLDYDHSVLELIDVENGQLLTDMDRSEEFNRLQWSANAQTTEDGVLCVLTFRIAEGVELGEYSVRLILERALNEELEEVYVCMRPTTVQVVFFVYGDVNDDGLVDLVDLLMLRKYLANQDPVTGESVVDVAAGADTNGDGVVDLQDVMMLRRYLVHRNPVTGESSEVLGPQD